MKKYHLLTLLLAGLSAITFTACPSVVASAPAPVITPPPAITFSISGAAAQNGKLVFLKTVPATSTNTCRINAGTSNAQINFAFPSGSTYTFTAFIDVNGNTYPTSSTFGPDTGDLIYTSTVNPKYDFATTLSDFTLKP